MPTPRPRLGVLSVSAQSFGMISPIAAVAFLSPLLASKAGPLTHWTVLVAGIAMLLMGNVISSFARTLGSASSGVFHAYVGFAAGPAAGLFVGLLYVIALLFVAIGGGAFTAHITLEFFTTAFHLTATPPPTWPVLFLLQAAAFAFCYRDVRWSVGIVLSVTAASAALVCVLCFMIAIGRTMDHAPRYLNASTIGTIVAHANGMNRKAASSSLHVLAQLNGNGNGSGSGNYSHLLLPVRDPAVPIPATAGGFFSGLVLALTMFAGFESAAVLGGEAESPRVVVPRAVSLTVLCCTVFFWLVAMSLTLGYDQTGEWAADTSPLTTMATRWGFVGLPTAMYSSVIFDGWAGNVACITVVSRLCVSLSRIGFLPRCCGRLHPTHRSPVVAAAAVCALVVSSTVLCEAAGSRICTVSSRFSFCLSVSGILLQVCYAAVAISAACYFPYENNRHTPARAIAVAASAIPLVAVGAAFYAATSDFVSAAAIVVATVWVAACGLVVAVAPAWVVVALPAGDDSETGDGGAGGAGGDGGAGGGGGGESNGGDEIEVASRGGAEGEEDAANVGEGEDAAAWSEYAESLAHATTEETQRSSERASLLSVN